MWCSISLSGIQASMQNPGKLITVSFCSSPQEKGYIQWTGQIGNCSKPFSSNRFIQKGYAQFSHCNYHHCKCHRSHGAWENIVWHIDHNSVGDSGNISLRLSLVVPCAGTGEWEILWHGNQMGNCGFTSVGMTFIHTCGQCLSKVSQYNLMIILANSRSNYDGPRPTCRQLYSKSCINISSNVAN